jgi:hypothetical protein
MKDLPDGISAIGTRLEELEKRVYALEHPGVTKNAAVVERAPAEEFAFGASTSAGAMANAGGTFSLLGRALLGIAGAYLLRALQEAQSLPNAALACVAIAYAFLWLAWSGRARRGEALAAAVYSCTSALILAPMVWELELRFHVLPAWMAAGVLAGFAVAGSIVGLKRELASVVWVSSLTGAGLALALSIATRNMVPFTGALLLMVVLQEYEAVRGRAGNVRVVVSIAADVALWALIYIYGGPEKARASYTPVSRIGLIAPGAVLFFIIAAGVIYATVFAHRRISVFEIVQMMVAFLLGACGLIYFGPPASGIVLGVCCLLMAAAGYALALRRFGEEGGRNLEVFATWSGALMVAGSLMAFPSRVMPLWMGSWSVAAGFIGARVLRMNLQVHSLVFLVVAAAGSGLLKWMAGELAGAEPLNTGAAAYFVMLCAIVCYACVARSREIDWKCEAIRLAFAVLVSGGVVALAVQGLTGLVAIRLVPEAHHLAFIRTLSVCMVAVLLGFSGARWVRSELTKISYSALALLVLKLALEDLRHGRMAFIAASIFLFAITLIAVPRVAKARAGKEQTEESLVLSRRT